MNPHLHDSETLVKSLAHHTESAKAYMGHSQGQPTMSDEDVKLTLLMLIMALEKQTVLNERLMTEVAELKQTKSWYHRFLK